MSPPISKEWWLAAALTGVSVPAVLAQPPAGTGNPIGVVASVRPSEPGKPGGLNYAPLVTDGAREQRIKADGSGPVHVMFSDRSAITLAPNSELVIKLYELDAQKKTGNMSLELLVGAARYVGGLISKKNGATMKTPNATIGIRGGIGVVDLNNNQTRAVLLFGDQLTVTPLAGGGATLTITRPGFGTTVQGNLVSTPVRVTPAQLQALMQNFAPPAPAQVGQVTRPAVPGGPTGPPIRLPTVAITVTNVFQRAILTEIFGSALQPSIRSLAGTNKTGS